MPRPSAAAPAPDGAAWLRRWEAMMAGYFAERERQFALLLDTIEVLVGREFTAVDLGAGPGSTSRRLLDRFPQARCVAVDRDPLLLALGRGTHAGLGERLTWLEADLADAGWPTRAGVGAFDLALSVSAFHDFPPTLLPAIYRGVYTILRPGGILLNGDTMRFGPGAALASRVTEAINGRHRDAPRHGERWDELLGALGTDPWLGPLHAERERRFAGQQAVAPAPPTLADHEAAARAAGFDEVDTLWQHLDFRLLLALRPTRASDEPAAG